MANNGQYYRVSHSQALRPLLSNQFVALAVHWMFQGILHMGRTERSFKICLEILMVLALWLLLVASQSMAPVLSLLPAILLAHSLNFILNAHPWVVLKHFGVVQHNRQEFCSYLDGITQRVKRQEAIVYAATYGSLAREEWKSTSDLDVRLVRGGGIKNSIHACVFVLLERARAFFQRFPLDIYLLDDFSFLDRLRKDEPPIVLLDRGVTAKPRQS